MTGTAGGAAPRSRSARRSRTAPAPGRSVTGAQVRAERVRGAADVPADRAGRDAGQHDAGLPRRAQRVVDAVQPPHREQAGDAAAEHPHDVLVEQVLGDVGDVRHREQPQVRGVQPTSLGRAVEVVDDPGVVAHRGGEEADPRAAAVDAGEVERVLGERAELPAGASGGTSRRRSRGSSARRRSRESRLGLWTTRIGRRAALASLSWAISGDAWRLRGYVVRAVARSRRRPARCGAAGLPPPASRSP